MSKDKPIVATGFESAFIKSWEDWDEIDTVKFQFYKVVLADELAKRCKTDQADAVFIDLEKMEIQVFNDEDRNERIVYTGKIEIGLA